MLAAAVAIALAAPPSTCVTLTGRVAAVFDRDGLLAGVAVGELARGHWRYPDGLPASHPLPDTSIYASPVPPAELEVSVGPYAARAERGFGVAIGVLDRPDHDEVGIGADYVASNLPGAVDLRVALVDSDGTALASQELPVGPPDLAPWEERRVYLTGCFPPDCETPAWSIAIDLLELWSCRDDTALLRGADPEALPLDPVADRWLDQVMPGDVDALAPWEPLTVYEAPGRELRLVRDGAAAVLR